METEKTKRVIKFFKDGKHVKSLPMFYAGFEEKIIPVMENIFLLNPKRKRLSDSELELIGFEVFELAVYRQVKHFDKLTKEVLSGSKPVGCRFVNSKKGNRHEICFNNGLKAKCDKELYILCPHKLPDAYLNY